MSTENDSLYEQGDALLEVIPDLTESRTYEHSESVNDLMSHEALDEFTEDDCWEWLSKIVENGQRINHELNQILDEIYDCRVPFYSFAGRRRLRVLMDQLHEVRGSIRAFERDVEELSFVFSKSDSVETIASESAEISLSNIEQTYNRAYDLSLYKLDQISNGWITATNLLISLTILIVTILFWMEFWE